MAALQPILAFIRKNTLSLICGLVAIGALVALFWPITSWYTELQTTVDARKSVFTSMNALIKKPRTLPLLDPFSTQPVPLPEYPTEAVFQRAKLVTADVASESKQMLETAKNVVSHKQLVTNALPNGGTKEATFFREQYQQLMTYPNLDAERVKLTLPISILHAAAPPTADAIKLAQDNLKTQITQEKTQTDSSGAVVNADAVTQLITDGQAALPDQMRYTTATTNRMYIADDAVHINPGLVGVAVPSPTLMFNAQSTLWLIQDVFTAIAAADEGVTGGIPASPIKHLIRLEYTDSPLLPIGATVSTDPNAPAAPVQDPMHPTSNPLLSPTGHVSNGLYDVVPFNLRIIVDAESIPFVLAALSKHRFITILKMDVLTVDSGEALLRGFIYGAKPVVQLKLSCEELFFRDETIPFMPDAVKKMLGVAPPTAAPTS